MSRLPVSEDILLPGQAPAEKPPSTRCLVVNLIDYDGCLSYRKKPISQGDRDWLAQRHPLLIPHFKKNIERKKNLPCKVIFALGTLRQDHELDNFNKKSSENGSCITPFFNLQQYFESIYNEDGDLNVSVFFDPFMMADVYNPVSRNEIVCSGESYTRIYLNKPIDESAKTAADKEKISLIYAHAHKAALLDPTADIEINFFDDQLPIIECIYNFFSQHHDLLPANMTLKLYHYYHNTIETGGERKQRSMLTKSEASKTVKGNGEIDKNYDWTLRMMSVIAKKEKTWDSEGKPIPSKTPNDFLKNRNSWVDDLSEIQLSTYFNESTKKDFLQARKIMQEWASRIYSNSYTTTRDFEKKWGKPTAPEARVELEELGLTSAFIPPLEFSKDRRQEQPAAAAAVSSEPQTSPKKYTLLLKPEDLRPGPSCRPIQPTNENGDYSPREGEHNAAADSSTKPTENGVAEHHAPGLFTPLSVTEEKHVMPPQTELMPSPSSFCCC